jgi:hypothetical protein
VCVCVCVFVCIDYVCTHTHTQTHTHTNTYTHTYTHQVQNALLRQLINTKFPRDKIPRLHQSLPPRGFRPRLHPITPHAAPFRQQSLLLEGPEIWRDLCLFFFEGISGIRRRRRLCTEILRSQSPSFYYSKSPRVYYFFLQSHYRRYFFENSCKLRTGIKLEFLAHSGFGPVHDHLHPICDAQERFRASGVARLCFVLGLPQFFRVSALVHVTYM